MEVIDHVGHVGVVDQLSHNKFHYVEYNLNIP